MAPANTPVKIERGGGDGDSNSSSGRTVSSSSTLAAQSVSGSGDEDEDEYEDGEDEEEREDEDDGQYNPSLDPELQVMYRQSISSVTKTVSVTNAPAPVPVPTPACNQTAPTKDEKTWNPPLAPKAMKSHMITWINDKKVGERINGVQVPVEDEEGGEEGKKGGMGKMDGKVWSGILRGRKKCEEKGGRKS